MTPTIDAHKEIPGNPSTAKSSRLKLNDRSNGEPLRILTEADWNFWITNGYVVIKICGNTKTRTPTTRPPGTGNRMSTCR